MDVLNIRDGDGKFIAIPMLKGDNGKSAYQIALDNGFEGTEAEWLESLRGKNGVDGKNGKDGQSYILTEVDKQDIAQMAVGLIPTTEGVEY